MFGKNKVTSDLLEKWKSSLNKVRQHEEKEFLPEIYGLEDAKLMLKLAIESDERVHVLINSPPGMGKSEILSSLQKYLKVDRIVTGEATTKAGVINYLFDVRPKWLLLDEIDKLSYDEQTSLLNMMATGNLSETKVTKDRSIKLNTRVIAASNSIDDIMEPLQTRFMIVSIEKYSEQEFLDVSVRILEKKGFDIDSANVIARKIRAEIGEECNIRHVVSIARLIKKSPEHLDRVIKIVKRQEGQ